MKHFISVLFLTSLWASPVVANCINLKEPDSFSLVRNTPYMAISNTVSDDGTVTEVRESTLDGRTEQVTTTYWNGVIAVDRKSSSSHVQVSIDQDAKSANLSEPGKTYSFPISIFVNGNEIDRGSFTINTIEETTLSLGGCDYAIMIVRTSLERTKGPQINEEALLSLDAGILLGNVAMTPDWQPRSGVFFDEIAVN